MVAGMRAAVVAVAAAVAAVAAAEATAAATVAAAAAAMVALSWRALSQSQPQFPQPARTMLATGAGVLQGWITNSPESPRHW